MIICLVVFAVAMAWATFIEAIHGTDIARKIVFNAKWFELVMVIGAINLLVTIFTRKLYRRAKLTVFMFHLSFVIIILGAGITRYISYEGTMLIMEGESSNSIVSIDKTTHELPFEIFLKDFIVDYYPGSQNPSGFESQVKLIDPEKNIKEDHRIYMNNILKHRGYRFYQSSYTEDKQGTVLSVSKDAVGTSVSYTGYILLALGMLLSLFNKNSRFISLIRNKTAFLVLISFFLSPILKAQSSEISDSIPVIPLEHATKFGNILVRDFQGRTKPMNTLVSDVMRKVNRSDKFENQTPTQVFLGILAFPEQWQNVKLIYAGTDAAKELGLKDKYVSILECYDGQGSFISSIDAYKAHQKSAGQRTKTENAIIKFDERLNITYHWFMGNMLTIFPLPDTSTEKWFNPLTIKGKVETKDSIFVDNIISMYLNEVKKSTYSGDWSTPDELVSAIIQYQQKNGTSLPSVKKISLEQWYYKSGIFKRSSYLYLLLGLLLLIVQFVLVFNGKSNTNILSIVLSGGILGVLLLHTLGLAIRWYISSHAPWSNAYETMVFISWSSVVAGSIFVRRNPTAFSIAAIMGSIFLVVAHMSWMDPQITNLVPVLRSKWLVIHVAVITSSYGFLGIGALMAFNNMVLMSIQNKKNLESSNELINLLTRIIEITLTIGLYLLTVGTFLGAVWANVSWGRYWGWDPKETWALITAIIYAIVLHFRLIPSLRSRVLFNISALVAYASVLMTYFGVNFYLSGLHSYAQGDPAPIPMGVYYTIAFLVVLSIITSLNQKRLNKI